MQESPKRKHSNNEFTHLFRAFAQEPSPQSGFIKPELHAKESLDFFEAQSYFNTLKNQKTDTNIYLEFLIVDEKNEIIYSDLIEAKINKNL